MEEKNAVILLFLSDTKENQKTFIYKDEQGNTYEGNHTNDAPLRYLINHINQSNTKLSQILCITSLKVKQEQFAEPALIHYQRIVFEESGENVHLEEIPYDYQIVDGQFVDVERLEERSFQIYNAIKDIDLSKSHIYVDYTGGLRDISYLMTSLIRYFEITGVKCQKVIYSNFQSKSINDISYIYEMYQMISGTNEFISYGNAKQLKELFKNDHDPLIKDVINSIVNFSNTLSLCNVAQIDKSITDVVSSIEKFEKFDYKDIKHASLQYLIPTIKENMQLNKIVINHQINYPLLIKWCLRNDLLQQAITLYIEKMPHYYLNNGIFPNILIKKDSSKNEPDIFYGIFDTLKEVFDPETREICHFSHILNTIDFSDCQERRDYISLLNKYQNQIKTKTLFDFIKKSVDKKGVSYNKHIKIYDKSIQINNISSFLNSLKNNIKNNRNYIHYFIYNNPDMFKKYDQFYKDTKASQGELTKTYKKKAMLLQYLVENEIDNKDIILEILAYYLSFKFIRNRINHAVEKDLDENECYLKNYLESLQLPSQNKINLDTSFDNIKKLLSEAISITKDS